MSQQNEKTALLSPGRDQSIQMDEEDPGDVGVTEIYLNRKAMGGSLMLILGYYVIGIIFSMTSHSFNDEKDLSFLDSLYYWTITLTTIGYGDVFPVTSGGRMFVVFWILIGLGMVGFALSIVANYLVAKQQKMMEELLAQDAQDAQQQQQQEQKKSFSLGFFQLSEAQKSMLQSLIAMVILFFIGTLTMCLIEDWDVWAGIYWSVVTGTTVGYGDLTPSGPGGKVFTIFYALIGTLLTAFSLGKFADLFVESQREAAIQRILSKKLDHKSIATMDADGDGKVSPLEFVEHMLVKLGKVSEQDILELKEQFRKLDTDASGFLDQSDLDRL
eukprot:CAMPEP_0201475658 /NCGR_PEP_ID=MMETSP0151_2-20130828/1037_1 /ASSEMBLY_ACC=CAM_ASM_000257 /TAXON_ID=200890 /ORGANISM="Paramoeba atlantica, Strain 621/1 / CCAP 1560/9" /LENGTH=328 /DNA_ID=CAMNT_0047855807 /DNA_START=77 /DNA_END=1063 /DNA_ORIENTATION=+